jgi:uncharacterized coiled-coil DUF342 family protein
MPRLAVTADKRPEKPRKTRRRTSRAKKPTPRRVAERLAQLEQSAQIRGQTIDGLTDHVAELNRWVVNLNDCSKVDRKAVLAIIQLLVSQFSALRDLLVTKDVITAEEVAAVAQITELERMLAPWEITKDADSPAGESR